MKNTKDKMITIITVLILIIGAFIIYKNVTAKEYKLKTCAICREKKECYEINFDGASDKYNVWVCSKKCEDSARSLYSGLSAIGKGLKDKN